MDHTLLLTSWYLILRMGSRPQRDFIGLFHQYGPPSAKVPTSQHSNLRQPPLFVRNSKDEYNGDSASYFPWITLLPNLGPASVSPASLPRTREIASPGSYATLLQPQTPSHLLSMPPLTPLPTHIPSIQFGACLPRILQKSGKPTG